MATSLSFPFLGGTPVPFSPFDGRRVASVTGLCGPVLGAFMLDAASAPALPGLFDLSPADFDARLRMMSIGYASSPYPSGSLPDAALRFASVSHGVIGHVRKYSGTPYIDHPIEVAELVEAHGGDAAMIAAALLHDVVEDTGVLLERVHEAFGDDIAGLVGDLTDVSRPEDGNRKARKAIDLRHTAAASPRAKSIKLADLVSNSLSIVRLAPGFARVYLPEKAALLEVLREGDVGLFALAQFELRRGLALLGMEGNSVALP